MKPLAERMRPKQLSDYIGQEHLVGPRGVLQQTLAGGQLPSLLLWGPPGVGKTTLARILAQTLGRPFQALSAISSGVKDVREAIEKARRQHFFDQPGPILFIDEIHRFSKAQQDALLGAVEDGTLTLIGATTENPSFEVIPALLSRCQVYTLHYLSKENLIALVDKAVREDEYLAQRQIEVGEYDALLGYSGGDARRLYNILELLVQQQPADETVRITNEKVAFVVQHQQARYDKGGEQHYDIASALIKSIRGSDPNGAVYWLARMIEGGEDPKFIARRLVISASEDIGLANPNALLLATTTFQAVQMIGMPEARILLSQAAIYLACSPKSNSAYLAIQNAQALVRQGGVSEVPLHLRNAPTQLMKELDYGTDYLYAHDHPGNFVTQEYLPENLSNHRLYSPQGNAAEQRLHSQLADWWKGKYGYGKTST